MNRKPQSLKQSLKQPAPPLSFAAFQFPAFLMDKGKIKKKSRLRIPLGRLFLCRWWGSNPHVLLAQGILSPPRLPFRHTGVFYFTDNIVIIADFSPKIKMQLTTHQISANFLSPFGSRACILRETTSYPKECSL